MFDVNQCECYIGFSKNPFVINFAFTIAIVWCEWCQSARLHLVTRTTHWISQGIISNRCSLSFNVQLSSKAEITLSCLWFFFSQVQMWQHNPVTLIDVTPYLRHHFMFTFAFYVCEHAQSCVFCMFVPTIWPQIIATEFLITYDTTNIGRVVLALVR